MRIGTFVFSLILTTLILVNSMRASFIYAYYNIDPIGFIEALCENQDKPELQCNGKCQLKKVAESQDKKQTTPESIIDFKQLVFYPQSIDEYQLPLIILTKKQLQIAYQNLYTYCNSDDCFHPPRV